MADKIPVWIDCDPGHDDVFAILLATSLPWFSVVGISTVFGNSSLSHTTTNTLEVLTAFNHTDINVYPGAEKSLVGFTKPAETIHGHSGLDGTSLLPAAQMVAQPDHSAVEGMVQAINNSKDGIYIVAIGPLTNISQLVSTATPETLAKVRGLSIMGGGIGLGNWTEYAEFNIWADVKAAEIVFQSTILAPKTLLVPLNVTHQAIVTKELAASIKCGQSGDPCRSVVRQMLYELVQFFSRTYKNKFGFEDGPPLHDPLAVYGLLHLISVNHDRITLTPPMPNIGLVYKRCRIHVIQSGEKRGKLVTEEVSEDEGIMVAESTDMTRFWKILMHSIEVMDRQTRLIYSA